MMDNLREKIILSMHRSLEEYRKTQDITTGRFLAPNGGWAITMQDPILPFAYLYRNPGTPYYKDASVYKVILDAVRALRNHQNPDGRMEFIKVDGSTWGPIYMPWTWYHWLETYELMKDELTPETKKDWEDGLMPGLESYGKMDPEHVHNIPVWQAMTCHRASIIFGRQDWKENSDKLIANCVKQQHADGFWAEHKGPTVGYNTVYVHSLGLYRFQGGSVPVLDAIKRAVKFQQAFHYPGGTEVEVIDGRQQYHWRHYYQESLPRHLYNSKNVSREGLPILGLSGWASYLQTAGGRAFIDYKLSHYSDFNISGAHAVSVLQYLDKTAPVDPDEGLAGFNTNNFKCVYGSASIERENEKQITLSAYTAPKTPDRWGLDRMCYISFWTPGRELALGGGNTRGQSEHATFLFKSNDGTVISDVPESAEILSVGKLRLNYSAGTAYVEAWFENGNAVFKFSVENVKQGTDVSVNIPLRPSFDPQKEQVKTSVSNGKSEISWNGIRVSFGGDFALTSPSRPFNPYEPEGISQIHDYNLLLSLPGGNHTVTVSAE